MNSSNVDAVRDQTSYRDYWTIWYNVDSPWNDDGDYETVERIVKVYQKICNKGFQICAAQCQVHGHDSEVFDKDTHPPNNSDVLERPCTTDGIICKNGDQSSGIGLCQDYEIQFRCHYTGENTSTASYFNPFDIRIYVILALVPLLLIFGRMLWVYIYRRRQHRARNPRLGQSNVNNANEFSKAPPSYQELFSKKGSSVFAISRENLPICSLCQSKPCSVALIINETKPSENPKGKKQNRELELNYISQITDEPQTMNSVPNTVGIYRANVEPSALNLRLVASSSQETTVCLDHSEINNVYIEITSNGVSSASNNESTLERAKISRVDNININNDISEEMYPNRNTEVQPHPSAPSTSCQVHPEISQSAIYLNPVSLKLSTISEPCACQCHRTIPSKQKGVSGYDNSGYTTAVNDTETIIHPVYGNMHRPIFNINGVQSDKDLSDSLTQLELPSYEDALELMKLKAREQNKQEIVSN